MNRLSREDIVEAGIAALVVLAKRAGGKLEFESDEMRFTGTLCVTSDESGKVTFEVVETGTRN